jgi:hypothetical protein
MKPGLCLHVMQCGRDFELIPSLGPSTNNLFELSAEVRDLRPQTLILVRAGQVFMTSLWYQTARGNNGG